MLNRGKREQKTTKYKKFKNSLHIKNYTIKIANTLRQLTIAIQDKITIAQNKINTDIKKEKV